MADSQAGTKGTAMKRNPACERYHECSVLCCLDVETEEVSRMCTSCRLWLWHIHCARGIVSTGQAKRLDEQRWAEGLAKAHGV